MDMAIMYRLISFVSSKMCNINKYKNLLTTTTTTSSSAITNQPEKKL